jgi:GNAT superfamily N-acetyltransferase
MITFRSMNAGIPQYWDTNLHWQIEYYPDETEAGAPLGLAWVSDCTAGGSFASLDYVLVRDDFRRQGIGTELVRACRERWPDLRMDAVSECGEAFLDYLERADYAINPGRGR